MHERNEEGYQTLGWIINQSENGLFLVIAEEPIQQEIVEVYRGGMIGVYDYRRNPGEFSFADLKAWIDAQENVRTFFIVNFQFAIPGQQDIDRLNFSRDMLTGLGRNLVFFTTPYGDDRLARGAYDFYSFLKIRITFHDYMADGKKGDVILSLDTEAKKQEAGQQETDQQEAVQAEADGQREALKEEQKEDTRHRLQEAYSLRKQAEEYSDETDYRESLGLLLKARTIYEEVLGLSLIHI